MSSPLKPDHSVPADDENTYRLSQESPVAPEGIQPPPPVKNYYPKRAVRPKSSGAGTLARSDLTGGTLIGLNALVFVTSVCVMTLELTASRLIGKHVGSSLYTWTSVIGVVLAGITLGNWLGGWLADRFDRSRALGWMYLLGSLSCGSVLWLDQLVATIPRPESFSWPTWVVTVVASIFLLPALALGATSPLVASMALERSHKTGSTVGNVYAWGALGSIVGTFLTGFYLIDVWGTRSIVGMTATTLAVLAILVTGTRRVFRTGVVLGWLQLLGWTMLAANSNADAFAAAGLAAAQCVSQIQSESDAAMLRDKWSRYGSLLGEKLHEVGLMLRLRDDSLHQYHDESNYSDICIHDATIDGRAVKSLRLDKLIHSYYDSSDPTSLHYEYEKVYAAVTKRVTATSNPKTNELGGTSHQASACFYGGGGYIFPRWFLEEFPESRRIDVAELDPAVHKAVTTELGLTKDLEERIQTTIGDARNFVDDRLRENANRKSRNEVPIVYNFIYADAFNDFSIPWHLTTLEFLQKTHDLLSEQGVFQANIIDIYPRTEFPGTAIGSAEADYSGRLPNHVLADDARRDKYAPAKSAYAPLEVQELLTNRFQLRVSRMLTSADEQRLNRVTWPEAKPPTPFDVSKGFQPEINVSTERESWRKAIADLTSRSQKKREFVGTIPEQLSASGGALERWVPAAPPFEFVEAYRIDGDKHLLGFRGLVSPEAARQLVEIDPKNSAWADAVTTASVKSRSQRAGRFMGRYVATAAQVFPNVYLFSTSQQQPDANRDTFVMVCSRKPLDLKSLDDTGDWNGGPFASLEKRTTENEPVMTGQMRSVIALAEDKILTDDYAPVDNLLVPVFETQE